MSDDNGSCGHNHERRHHVHEKSMWGGFYGMGFIGAAVYFISHAVSFWGGVWGFCKALFWPAVLMYKLLEYLQM